MVVVEREERERRDKGEKGNSICNSLYKSIAYNIIQTV